MATTAPSPHDFWEEKISIEPDLGDPRQSTYKALPAPPKTPKRVLMKYRVSGVLPLVLSLAAFVLSLVVVLAGQNGGVFEERYLFALNTSRLGQDVVMFERASATATTPSAPTASKPLDALNPLSINSGLGPSNADNPLQSLSDSLGTLAGNLTNAFNEGLGEAINSVVAGVVNQTGIEDFYYVYLRRICRASIVAGDGGNADGVETVDCRSYNEAGDSISALRTAVHTSLVVGQTRISVPLLARLVAAVDSMLRGLDALRKAVFALLVITLVGCSLSVVSVLPAVYFPQSRLLVYFNMCWPGLASVSALLAAVLLSGLHVLVSALDGFSGAVGVQVRRGGVVLLFVWLGCVVTGLAAVYWAGVWFVEVRRESFVKRRRDDEEVGCWRGIWTEIWRDLTGRRRAASVRAGI